MLFSAFSFSEVALSDIKLQIREFWFEIAPTDNETWASITKQGVEQATTLTTDNPATSFSEFAFSQLGLSDLGLTLKREPWRTIIGTSDSQVNDSVETWSNVSPSGTETWSTILPSGDESWVDISTRII